jgi:hypothetical protein
MHNTHRFIFCSIICVIVPQYMNITTQFYILKLLFFSFSSCLTIERVVMLFPQSFIRVWFLSESRLQHKCTWWLQVLWKFLTYWLAKSNFCAIKNHIALSCHVISEPYVIKQLLHLNLINMRFYGAEYNNIELGIRLVQYCCTLLHKTSYW